MPSVKSGAMRPPDAKAIHTTDQDAFMASIRRPLRTASILEELRRMQRGAKTTNSFMQTDSPSPEKLPPIPDESPPTPHVDDSLLETKKMRTVHVPLKQEPQAASIVCNNPVATTKETRETPVASHTRLMATSDPSPAPTRTGPRVSPSPVSVWLQSSNSPVIDTLQTPKRRLPPSHPPLQAAVYTPPQNPVIDFTGITLDSTPDIEALERAGVDPVVARVAERVLNIVWAHYAADLEARKALLARQMSEAREKRAKKAEVFRGIIKQKQAKLRGVASQLDESYKIEQDLQTEIERIKSMTESKYAETAQSLQQTRARTNTTPVDVGVQASGSHMGWLNREQGAQTDAVTTRRVEVQTDEAETRALSVQAVPRDTTTQSVEESWAVLEDDSIMASPMHSVPTATAGSGGTRAGTRPAVGRGLGDGSGGDSLVVSDASEGVSGLDESLDTTLVEETVDPRNLMFTRSGKVMR
ncbi:hypothetical protein J8273_2054 [Carpediemonas membranifera]|uniref:Uncharacterized protein n=1 Tax=Carpediemonas membranifera TaxID=201153 RepID=A0A8J6E3S7_9EUKA|nr:hypothetical protein J8273_2054 [Carpediemonas membranifera]|eukprot:KAG9396323.1 hypothetical protein J8273_2054 [Carpediemonas membranifera]